MKVFDIQERLRKEGFEFELFEDTYFIARNKKFMIRAIQERDLFQIGMKETFDRWANSVDMEYKYPYKEKDLDKILDEINNLKRCSYKETKGHRCMNWELRNESKYICDECKNYRNRNNDEKRKSYQRRKC